MTLRIVLLQPPPGIDFGLQKGKGTNYEIVQKQRSAGSDLQFELEVGIKPGPHLVDEFDHLGGRQAAMFEITVKVPK